MPDGAREQLFLVHLYCEGVDLGVWDTWSGGDKDTDNTQYRSGGSPDQENLGGGNTYTAITISRNYRLSRDRPVNKFLMEHTGSPNMLAIKQALDRGYNATGAVTVARGLFKTYSDPKSDSNSNNAAMMTVTLEPDSVVAS